MEITTPKTFAVQCMAFFGRKEGQTLAQFAAEIRQLTDTDRKELTKLLASEGYPVLGE